jgi:hypothetical protein
MVKKGDDVAVDDDDAVRTSVSQTRVAATLCNEELFLRTQYTYIDLFTYQTGKNVEGGTGCQPNTNTQIGPSWVHTSELAFQEIPTTGFTMYIQYVNFCTVIL